MLIALSSLGSSSLYDFEASGLFELLNGASCLSFSFELLFEASCLGFLIEFLLEVARYFMLDCVLKQLLLEVLGKRLCRH